MGVEYCAAVSRRRGDSCDDCPPTCPPRRPRRTGLAELVDSPVRHTGSDTRNGGRLRRRSSQTGAGLRWHTHCFGAECLTRGASTGGPAAKRCSIEREASRDSLSSSVGPCATLRLWLFATGPTTALGRRGADRGFTSRESGQLPSGNPGGCFARLPSGNTGRCSAGFPTENAAELPASSG